MKTRSIKRVAGAAAGAAVAATSMAALAPLPAGAAGGPYVVIGATASGLIAGIQSVNGVGGNVSVHNGADANIVIVDSNVPISIYSGPGCVLGASGNSALPNRVTCSAQQATSAVQLNGSAQADNITANTPGHAATIYGGDGNDTIDTLNSLGDSVYCQGGASDKAIVDHIDVVGAGCDVVKYSRK